MLQASKVSARGIWLALLLGTMLSVSMWISTPFLLGVFTKDASVLHHARPFLRSRAIAFPALLTIFAAAGSFRGYRDTRCGPWQRCREQGAHFRLGQQQIAEMRCALSGQLADEVQEQYASSTL